MADELSEAVRVAQRRHDDVDAQVRAAYACDRAGHEQRAVRFYDAAARLGGSVVESADFRLAYGSTLRNVGRHEEAVRMLEDLVAELPDDHAARCFYALALSSLGRTSAALGELLEVGLSLHEASPSLTRYRRALASYRDELRAE